MKKTENMGTVFRMIKRGIVSLMAVLWLSGAGMALAETQLPYETVKQMLEEEDILLVDVRTKEEYEENRIPGAILLPLDDLEEQALQTIPDMEQKIFIYCRSGRRSATAAQWFLEQGYQNVFDIGGIIDWPFETEQGALETETEQECTEHEWSYDCTYRICKNCRKLEEITG